MVKHSGTKHQPPHHHDPRSVESVVGDSIASCNRWCAWHFAQNTGGFSKPRWVTSWKPKKVSPMISTLSLFFWGLTSWWLGAWEATIWSFWIKCFKNHQTYRMIYDLLLGTIPNPLKNMKVSWDDMTFPTEWKKNPNVPVTTNQFINLINC